MLNRATNIALGLALLLAPLRGWGQPQGWHYNAGGRLLGVKSRGSNIWVVGAQGLIIHSTDRGNTWNIRESGVSADLRGVSFPDDLHGWAVGDYGYVLHTTDGGFNWQIQTQLNTPWGWGVCFVDTLHGFVCGPIDTVYKTTDGGASWTKQTMNQYNHGTSIVFLDTLRGWMSTDFGSVEKTTDGGQTWIAKPSIDAYLGGVDMLDSLRGWTAGGRIFKTTDGGETWILQYTPPYGLNGVSIGDSLTTWTAGMARTIISTFNGGSSWNIDSSTASVTTNFYDVYGHLQLTNLTVVGDGGAIIRSTNAGNTWRVIRNVDIGGTTLYNTFFYNSDRGWAVGTYGVISYTTNGGTVWSRQASGTSSFLNGVDFPGPQQGWTCSDGGEILMTSNAGNTWTPQTSNTTYPLFSIDFTDTLDGVAVGGYYGPPEPPGPGIRDQGLGVRGQGGKALQNAKCKMQSANWMTNEMLNQVQHDGVRGLRNDALWRDDTLRPWGTGLDFYKWPWRLEETAPLTPYRTITRTTNGGALWIAQNTTGQVPLYGVSFVTPSEGWTCGDPQGGMGVILHTTDSGATWQGESSNVNQSLFWIQFLPNRFGWCVGGGGTALWTTDGGNTWNSGNTGTTATLWSCAFYDNLHGFACGGNGLLIMTNDGGRNWTPDTSNKANANLTALRALDSLHVWAVGSYGMVLGWRLAGVSGVEQGSIGAGELRVNNGIKVWPNPFVSYARVLGHEKERFALYDITGRKAGVFPGDRIGEGLASGVYFLMSLAGENKPQRIVKIK